MKQIEATILGQSYMLACPPDGEALLREAVGIVDREMSAIRDAGKVKARERIAVLAALNLAYLLAEGGSVQAPQTAVDGDANAFSLPDLDGLLKRLDEALGHDGQLL
jgi:cell division protein ZapA